MKSEDDFIQHLIQGKIAEIIFEMMFRKTKKFVVLRSGYETLLPELAQYQHEMKVKEVVDQMRSSPDFLLITEDRKQAYFVEVKFRSHIQEGDILKIANGVSMRWPLCYIFVISIDGFYFDPVHKVQNNGGKISKLSERWVSADLQRNFLEYVGKFLSEKASN